MQHKRERRQGGKKLRLKIRRKKFLALTNGKYMWSGNPLLQLSTSLIFHTVCGRTTFSGKDLLGLPATPDSPTSFHLCPISWCLLCYSTSSVFNLQSHSSCAPLKFLKLSFILIVLSTTHTQVLNLHLRLLQYTPDRCIFKTAFWNFSLNILKLLWHRIHVYI